MIIARTGDTLIARNAGVDTTVVLTDETKTVDKRGAFGVREQQMADAVLIPGLKLEVNGNSDAQGRVIAKTIIVDGDDLETSEMIQAGLHPTAEQVAAHEREISANKQWDVAQQKQIEENMKDIEENTDRFMALAGYDVKDQATVKFPGGSSKISAQDQEQLKKLAQDADKFVGYIIEVTGFADATGSAAMNTKLSEDRAKAVVAYLFQQCGVPMRHIVAPGAMGEYGPAASNETKSGRAENRRAEVKILVNQGIAGK